METKPPHATEVPQEEWSLRMTLRGCRGAGEGGGEGGDGEDRLAAPGSPSLGPAPGGGAALPVPQINHFC